MILFKKNNIIFICIFIMLAFNNKCIAAMHKLNISEIIINSYDSEKYNEEQKEDLDYVSLDPESDEFKKQMNELDQKIKDTKILEKVG